MKLRDTIATALRRLADRLDGARTVAVASGPEMTVDDVVRGIEANAEQIVRDAASAAAARRQLAAITMCRSDGRRLAAAEDQKGPI